MKDFELQVFDRWGSRLFQSTNIYEGADGKTGSGKLYELGTYAYKVYVRYIDGTEKTLVGPRDLAALNAKTRNGSILAVPLWVPTDTAMKKYYF